ncbi:MAG: hypothetical protein JO247_11815 [Chloroflexi bacterium]|nr:hypothetical protein [Chloroflexota bacterium]
MRPLPRPFKMPWGGGQIVEEATCDNEWHSPTIQLLRYDDGQLGIRFCSYTHDGRFQRSPLMINAADLPELRRSLESAPDLAALLRRLVA